MKKIAFYLFLLIVFTSCSNNESFKIKGKLRNADGGTIILKELKSTDRVTLDSAKINKDGSFVLKAKNNKPAFYSIYLAKNNDITLVINPGNKLIIIADARDLPHTYIVKGSKDAELSYALNKKLNETLQKVSKLGQTYQDSLGSRNILAIRARLDSTYKGIEADQKKFTKEFIRNNSHSLAAIMALYQQIGPKRSVLNPTQDYEIFRMVDSIMYIDFPEADAVQSLHNVMKDLTDAQLAKTATEKRTALGAIAPEIALPNANRDSVRLSSTRGKYVLLDFWASWCEPCRVLNPNLVNTYWRYKNAGFEVFQVSLDRSRDAWINAMQTDKLYWINVSDLKMWNSPIAALYGIESIPANFLLDTQGKIIAKNISLSELNAKLKDIFKY
jgi:thiol-disulfide isomerase/thioredoxin